MTTTLTTHNIYTRAETNCKHTNALSRANTDQRYYNAHENNIYIYNEHIRRNKSRHKSPQVTLAPTHRKINILTAQSRSHPQILTVTHFTHKST